MGKINSKTKGKVGELEVVHILKDYGYEARRGQQFKGTDESPDVVSTFPFQIEVKRVQKLNLGEAMDQAMKDANGGDYCVIHRKNHEDWTISMPLHQFLKFIAPKVSIEAHETEIKDDDFTF